MTPKEKAEKLFVEYIYLLGCSRADGIVAAEKCVNEIMDTILPVGARNGHERNLEIFWQSVKEEITKL